MASADMSEHGIDVTVLAGPDRTDEGSFWDRPQPRRGTGPVLVEVPNLVRAVSPARDLKALWWLIRWLRTNRPDVVHTHSSKAGVLGRLAAAIAGIPCAHTVHGWGPLYADVAAGRLIARLVERGLARLCAALVVVGRTDLRRGVAARIGTPLQYWLIRSGVDTDAVGTAADRTRLRAELDVEDRFVIGMVARMAHPKDHATLIAAVVEADVADWTLVLVGDVPDRAKVERLVADARVGHRVRFLGQRDDAAVVPLAFDVAVLASLWEGMPRVVVEAAAAGVPVIASDVGSIGELIEPGVSGRLVPAGRVDGLTEALTDVARRPEHHRAMAAVARQRAEVFSVQRMRNDLAGLWTGLSGHAVSGRPRRAVRLASRSSTRRRGLGVGVAGDKSSGPT